MAWSDRRQYMLDWCWFLVCAIASSAWCVTASSQLSATFDEPVYLTQGLEGWRAGSHSGLIRLGTMPLPIDLDTLPVFLWERWRGTPFDVAADFEQILPVARLGTLVFWWGLLLFGWLAARRLAGPWGGRLAVVWLASEPNLLAHASLATTDIAISACLLAFCYFFVSGREGTWRQRVALPGFWCGAALLAKASALVFVPLCMIVIELDRLARNGALRSLLAHSADAPTGPAGRAAALFHRLRIGSLDFRREALQTMAIGFVVMMVYCGSDWRPEPSFVVWAHKLPAGASHDAMVWISEHLCIFSNGAEGIVRQIKHNLKGHHGAYLLGETHARSVWYYFPLALAIKLSLPLLLTPLALLIARRRQALNWACLAAFTLLAFSASYKVQIGVRLVLPLIVMLVVGTAAALAESATRASSVWRRRLATGGAALAAGWTVAVALGVWPHGLCYTNELWGDSSQGYLYLSDSNYDWGQGLKELKRWQRRQGLEHLDVWYFGADPTVNSEPLRNLPLHILPLNRPQDVPVFVQGDYVAVGATLLYGTTTLQPEHQKAVEYFRGRRPVARTTTFLIFDVDRPSVAARSTRPVQRQAARLRSGS